MAKHLSLLGLAITVLLFAVAASASQTFTTTLTGSKEVPPNSSTATGVATVVLDDTRTMISVNLTFTGLVGGPANVDHIHGPASAGTNAVVISPFSAFHAATSE